MRRIDFHCHADTKPWIASGRSWATRTRSSSNSTRTPSVVFGLYGATREAGMRPPPHRLAALHQLLQHGAGSGARSAEGAGQLTREATSLLPKGAWRKSSRSPTRG
jgi:hypothetical protein